MYLQEKGQGKIAGAPERGDFKIFKMASYLGKQPKIRYFDKSGVGSERSRAVTAARRFVNGEVEEASCPFNMNDGKSDLVDTDFYMSHAYPLYTNAQYESATEHVDERDLIGDTVDRNVDACNSVPDKFSSTVKGALVKRHIYTLSPAGRASTSFTWMESGKVDDRKDYKEGGRGKAAMLFLIGKWKSFSTKCAQSGLRLPLPSPIRPFTDFGTTR